MKKIFFTLIFCPLFSSAQTTLPRFENDTLYTSGGFKIFEGKILQLGKGTDAAGYFRFLKFHSRMGRNDTYTLQNGTLLVNKLKSYKYANPDDNSIRISGTVTYTDGKKADIDILLNFERATENYDGLASELIVPEEFKNKRAATVTKEPQKQTVTDEIKKQPVADDIKKLLVADEIKKLFDLYKAGALTKEEYETQKKKLLDRQ